MDTNTISPEILNSHAIIPDEEMRTLAISSLQYANSYFTTLQKSLANEESRFDNELLYQLAIMSVEKYFVALLARYDWAATHHMPVAMYKEAMTFEPELTPEMKQTAILIGKFEGICSIDGFGYRIPSKDELLAMEAGLNDIKTLVEKRLAEI
jgi:hypothetical protein